MNNEDNMKTVNANERSWAIEVINEINFWAHDRNVIIKRAGGESTLSSDNNTKLFPDVLLYGDSDDGAILQGWELKLPDTPIDDDELIENAYKKSKILGLDSFLVWNVKSAILYKRDKNDKKIIKRWNKLSYTMKTREDIFSSKELWKEFLYEILDELVKFFKDKTINYTPIINSLSSDELTNFILSNIPSVSNLIKEKSKTNSELNDDIIIWWTSAKNEHEKDANPYDTLAKIVLVSWMNKLLFANLLKKYQEYANEVEKIVDNVSLEEGITILERISDKCDFKNIFKIQLAENCLSDIAWNSIKSFNKFLIDFQLNILNHETLQQILINTVKKSSKKISGQYTTPYNLGIFLSNLTILDKTKCILDPCCGTGTIVNAVYYLKTKFGIDEKESLNNIWASDKFAFPLQLAMLTMTRPKHMGELVKIFKEDVVNLDNIKKVTFNNPNDGSKNEILFPKFDYILSNLPFVKQEDIHKLNNGIKDKVNSKINSLTKNLELKLDGKSDLYAYIPFALWDILESNGKLGIIISNSWLGAKWGITFYNILQYFYKIEYAIISSKGKWFKDVDVVTTILILKKREKDKIEILDRTIETKYVTLNIDINENEFKNKIGEICAFIRKNKKSEYFDLVKYSKLDEENILSKGLSKNALFVDLSWILEIGEKLIKVNSLFDISRGERR